MPRWLVPGLTLFSATLYWLAVSQQESAEIQPQVEQPPEIVVSGPIQVLFYGGDRFLAANIESVRAAASVTTISARDFNRRTHLEAARLNPCQEDNDWMGNASLSWGGAPDKAIQLLHDAMHCRFWDEWPAFFYGFNQHYFMHNSAEARKALEVAAQRSPVNASAFRTFSTMIAVGEIDDTRMAIQMLQRERDQSKDSKLHEMLDKRVQRLNGLLILRDAQTEYEKRFKRPLQSPDELLSSGLLKSFPEDPLKLGYEFRDHAFQLHHLKIE